jgi:hypothetical protein
MRIYFLLIVFFIQDIYAEFSQESNTSLLKLHPYEYDYSIQNLPKAVKKHKKTRKNILKNHTPSINLWGESRSNPQSNTDIIFNNNPGLLYGSRYDGKGPTHRELTGKQHEMLRNKALDFGVSPVIKPTKPDNMNLDKLLRYKMLDILLPSFKARIDL